MSRLVTRRVVSLDRRSSSCLNTFVRGFADKKDSEVVDASKVLYPPIYFFCFYLADTISASRTYIYIFFKRLLRIDYLIDKRFVLSQEPSGIALDPATTKVEAHRRYMKSKASVVPVGFTDMITEGGQKCGHITIFVFNQNLHIYRILRVLELTH